MAGAVTENSCRRISRIGCRFVYCFTGSYSSFYKVIADVSFDFAPNLVPIGMLEVQVNDLAPNLVPVGMLEIQVKVIPGAPGMTFSRTLPGSDFPVSCVGGFRYNLAATGRFVLARLPDLKTNAGLNIPGEPAR